MGTEKQIKKNIARIAEHIFKGTPVLFAYLYGSYAVDQAHPFSDLDIGIYVPELSQKEKLNLEMDLSLEIDRKLEHALETDVRVINSLPLAVAGNIVTEGILIYCRDDEIRVEYETTVRKAYFDFMPFICSYQKTYLEHVE